MNALPASRRIAIPITSACFALALWILILSLTPTPAISQRTDVPCWTKDIRLLTDIRIWSDGKTVVATGIPCSRSVPTFYLSTDLGRHWRPLSQCQRAL